MNVLTIGNRPLTIAECHQAVCFHLCCRYDRNESSVVPPEELNSQKPVIQEWFDLWCGEASAEHDLHADDDRDLLWEKFCEEVSR